MVFLDFLYPGCGVMRLDMMSSVVCNGALWGIHRYNKDIGSKGNHMIQNSEGGSAT